jgi:MFS family permease
MQARVTFPLAAANFINQAARTVIAIVGPVIAVELGLSAVELGVLAACVFASYAVMQLPLGVASMRSARAACRPCCPPLGWRGVFLVAMPPGGRGGALDLPIRLTAAIEAGAHPAR